MLATGAGHRLGGAARWKLIGAWVYYPGLMVWWLLSLTVAYVHLVGRGFRRRRGAGMRCRGHLTLAPAPQLVLPVRDETEPRYQPSIEREDAFHAQGTLLTDSLAQLRPQRPGVEDLYFVGFAGYAAEDVFWPRNCR